MMLNMRLVHFFGIALLSFSFSSGVMSAESEARHHCGIERVALMGSISSFIENSSRIWQGSGEEVELSVMCCCNTRFGQCCSNQPSCGGGVMGCPCFGHQDDTSPDTRILAKKVRPGT